MRPPPVSLPLLTIVAASLLLAPALAAQEQQKAGGAESARYAPIRRVFGQGESEGGYYRVNLPRSDLHVRVGEDTLSPHFEFTSYVGFAPAGSGVLAMGEVVLLQSEVPVVLAEARRQGVRVTALHNHLIGEEPRIVYMHVMAQGAPDAVAAKLRALFAKSATPLEAAPEEKSDVDWSAVDAVLGRHSEAEGRVAEYVFPRREQITVHGTKVKSSGTLETASEVVFERLGGAAGTRVASTGELYLLPGEVEGVLSALEAHGLHVTALHNHMLDDGPPHYWVHWYATGDGATLARGIEAALEKTNGARKAESEK